MNKYAERIGMIRSMMQERGWDAVIISGTDPHSSEYPAPRWQQVCWACGFTGEAGDLAITMDHAGLWTDSRYFIQAVGQLEGTGVELHRTRQPDSVMIPRWLADAFAGRDSMTVAVDGLCQSVGAVDELKEALKDVGGAVADVPDMLDGLWDGRPCIPSTPIVTLSDEQAGESRLERISWLRKFLLKNDCDSMLLTSLDEIAWLLNVRGSDIEYNPLVISYLLVTLDSVIWFVEKDSDLDPDTDDSFAELRLDEVEIRPYADLCNSLAAVCPSQASRLFVDSSTLNFSVWKAVAGAFGPEGVVAGESPVIMRKAVKNPVEIASQREAYFEDGIAMEKFLYWLENSVKAGDLDEWEASLKLTSLRAAIPGYRGDSFATISAYGPNAALPHYSTPSRGSAHIKPYGLYLVDSGGQYVFGTTDITRTVPMGECSALEKEDYTLVLKGMIQLSMAVFPAGTAGCQIDAMARMPLWRNCRNFGHGTGHGTGFWLCVHEGPQSIRQNFNSTPMLPGMITSNEPGIYREGRHGIRHENMILCRELESNEFGLWYGFETLTLCHIDTSAVVGDLLSSDEIQWLDDYNRHVYETLAPRLEPDVREWLRLKTMPLQEVC